MEEREGSADVVFPKFTKTLDFGSRTGLHLLQLGKSEMLVHLLNQTLYSRYRSGSKLYVVNIILDLSDNRGQCH